MIISWVMKKAQNMAIKKLEKKSRLKIRAMPPRQAKMTGIPTPISRQVRSSIGEKLKKFEIIIMKKPIAATISNFPIGSLTV
jgi:hypothetical protein